MSPEVLLDRLHEAGVTIRVEGESLCYAPRKPVDADGELLSALKTHKATLIEVLHQTEREQAEHARVLEERLTKGAALLYDREMRGETDGAYPGWLSTWEALLHEYERIAP